MASTKKSKPVGKIKLPPAFADMGLSIDPTRLKPGAWQNRDRNTFKGGLPKLNDLPNPSLLESKEEPQFEIGAEVSHGHNKPSIPKSMRRKRSNQKRPVLLMTTSSDSKLPTAPHHQKQASLRKHSSIPIPITTNNNDDPYLDDPETSNDETSDGGLFDNDLKIKYERNELLIHSQLREIEQLKTDKMMLEEWRTGVGEVAVTTVCTLETKIEKIQNESNDYQLQIEGLQTTNESLSQQITAYQDEIATFEKDKIPKMQTQITELTQMLSSETMIAEELRSKKEELSSLRKEYEAHRIAMESTACELRTLGAENEEIKRENESYLLLLDKLREEEVKLKSQVNEQQLEISEMTRKYHEIETKLRKETVETRQQLQVATHFANNLSDQLEEIHNFRKAKKFKKKSSVNSNDGNMSDSSDGIGFGRPLFEKRKTLKIMAYEHSLKLPNMMDMIEMCQTNQDDETDAGEDEFNEQEKPVFAATLQSKALPPVTENEFDVNDDKVNEFEDEEEEEEAEEAEEAHDGNNNKGNTTYEESFASYIAKNEHKMTGTEDKIDKMLRRISGSSYHKFRKGQNVAIIDAETRHKLKTEMVAYVEAEAAESAQIICKYRQESKEWETKYKCLKREIKKRKVKNAQNIQKVQDPVIGGCKFWNWGGAMPFQQKWVDLQKGFYGETATTNGNENENENDGNNNNKTAARFFVPDDSDDTDPNSNNNNANVSNYEAIFGMKHQRKV